MSQFKTLDDLEVASRRVLLRVDLNVPMKDGRVSDRTRIRRLVPTIKSLQARGARIVLLSHFGRPKGQRVAEMSLRPLVEPLSEALDGTPVRFAADCIGDEAAAVVDSLKDGEVALLENLRFHAGEESNDAGFAESLAALGDLFVNDAFSAAHRAHASVDALARLRPAAAGLLMQEELVHLAQGLEDPNHPVVALVGGAKVSTKLDLLGNLLGKVDRLIIGGGMANTFLAALGHPVGRSLCEHEMAARAREILAAADGSGCLILLPDDVVVAERLEPGIAHDIVPITAVPDQAMILDVGPATVAGLTRCLEDCKTLVWNGPLGCFETPPFDAGTVAIAQAAGALTEQGRLLSVAGGGDTVAALAHAGVTQSFSYISTAGGAFLEWLEGKELPGVAALDAAA